MHSRNAPVDINTVQYTVQSIKFNLLNTNKLYTLEEYTIREEIGKCTRISFLIQHFRDTDFVYNYPHILLIVSFDL